MLENIVVIFIVGIAGALLGRSYYKRHKKGNLSSCGCSSCPADASSCEFSKEVGKHMSEIQKPMEN